MKKLMIIDGNSIVNRAFYGIRLLTNSEGLYTNAVYGFLNILFKYLDEEQPDYLCTAFDVSAPTFRHEKFKDYKAQRKGMPEELAQQMPVLFDVLEAMNISMLKMPGYEADDIIGTISRLCGEKDVQCVILTGDKDDLQLARENTKIKLVITKAGTTSTTDYYASDVFEKYGVTPEQYIDVKGLMGDPSDNIPGVAGIGEKTAFDLIQRFTSIDEIYEKLNTIDVKPGVRSKLEAGREMARLSRELSVIDVNVPLRCDFDKFLIQTYNNEKLSDIFKKLNFSSFLKRLDLRDVNREVFTADNDAAAVFENIEKSKRMFYYILDGEAVIATGEEDIAVCEASSVYGLLADENIEKITFDAKEDIVRLAEQDKTLANLSFDVMIAAYIADPAKNSYEISQLAFEYLNMQADDSPAGKMAAIIRLYHHFCKMIEEREQTRLFYDVEMPLVRVLADMQLHGIGVDKEKLTAFGEMLEGRISGIVESIYRCGGCEFNINSPKQLGEVLFEKLRLPVIKKTKTGYSTNVEVLEKLKGSHEIIELIMEYRQLTKLKSTYVDGLIAVINKKTGRVHSNFNQTATVTGRISSTEPNMQNIPVRTELGREMRKMFCAPEDGWVLVDADYSQIELRILAHIANDKTMADAFMHNVDIHTTTASQVFGVAESEVTPLMRSNAKAVNFGIVYGIGEFSLSQDLNITRRAAREYIDNYLKNFSGVKNYMTTIVEQAKKDGYVSTVLNRRRYLPELSASNFVTRAFGERIALNTPIQGSAADIIKIAMVRVYEALKAKGLESRLVLQVHDELIVEAKENEEQQVREILKREMENAFPLSVPLSVDMSRGKTWYDAK